MPSCTRAPPESLMKINGEPVFSEWHHDLGNLDRMHLAGRSACHRKILAGQVDQPPGNRCCAGYHAVRGHLFAFHPEHRPRGVRQTCRSPQSCPDRPAPRSVSRAVILPALCCFSSLSAPPPSITLARRFFSSSIFFCIGACCFFFQNRHGPPSLDRCNRHFVRVPVQLHFVGNRLARYAIAIANRVRGCCRGAARLAAFASDLSQGSSGPDRGWQRTSPPPAGTSRTSAHLRPCRRSPSARWPAVRSSCHSGFSRSAGRISIGGFLACFSACCNQLRHRAARSSRRSSPASGPQTRPTAPCSAPAAR